MKLKPYTPEETDQLLADIDFIVLSAKEVNKKAVELLNDKYSDYVKNFRFSIFQWKPKTLEDFIKNYSWKSIIRINDPLDSPSEYSPFVQLYLNEYCVFYRSDIYWHRKLDSYTDSEFELLKHASLLSDFMYNYTFREKFTVLVKYAHTPFEFHEEDISWIEMLHNLKKSIEVYNAI